jgi:hypothetical protein
MIDVLHGNILKDKLPRLQQVISPFTYAQIHSLARKSFTCHINTILPSLFCSFLCLVPSDHLYTSTNAAIPTFTIPWLALARAEMPEAPTYCVFGGSAFGNESSRDPALAYDV